MREPHETHGRRGQAGFALILALMALVLLTFLGLTLATTTSTELQIATNYRWSQQAIYNAESGVEAAKVILRSLDWSAILPGARPLPWPGDTSPSAAAGVPGRNDQWGNGSRDYENWRCDQKGNGMGNGRVLDATSLSAPIQYASSLLGGAVQLNGAVTVWIRRPLRFNSDGSIGDYSADDDTLVLIAEGIAPFRGGNVGAGVLARSAAAQTVEVTLSREVAGSEETCEQRRGQSGLGSEGANFGRCDTLTGESLRGATGRAGGTRGTLGDTGAK